MDDAESQLSELIRGNADRRNDAVGRLVYLGQTGDADNLKKVAWAIFAREYKGVELTGGDIFAVAARITSHEWATSTFRRRWLRPSRMSVILEHVEAFEKGAEQ